MEFDKLVTNRFSVRSYTNQQVDRDTILKILDASRLAPSAVNYQPWHFIVITQPENLIEIQEAYPRAWFREAPVCIIICGDHSLSWKRKADGKDFMDIDVAIAIDHLVLKATDLGLGTCWVCNFDADLVRLKLRLPESVEPLAIIPIGYTNEKKTTKTRKKIEEVVHWEKF